MPIGPARENPVKNCLPAALSDAELLAIFLRTGTQGLTAVDLARTLLNRFDGLRPFWRLMSAPCVGFAALAWQNCTTQGGA